MRTDMCHICYVIVSNGREKYGDDEYKTMSLISFLPKNDFSFIAIEEPR